MDGFEYTTIKRTQITNLTTIQRELGKIEGYVECMGEKDAQYIINAVREIDYCVEELLK